MNESERERRAEFLFQEGYRAQQEKNFDEAIRLYQRSIEEHPTAEAHTFLGWAYSHLDRLEEAISECRRAIEVDPDFGNPYNDIGSYLMKMGKTAEAIEWLEKAKAAPRYEPRHYPYLNLGRLYLALGRMEDAAREFAQAKFIFESVVEPKERGEEEPPSVN